MLYLGLLIIAFFIINSNNCKAQAAFEKWRLANYGESRLNAQQIDEGDSARQKTK
jgi:hypothetical protein